LKGRHCFHPAFGSEALEQGEIFNLLRYYARVNTVNPGLQTFLTVALPIMVTMIATIWIAQWSQNKRLDELSASLNKRIDELRSEMMARFAEVFARLDRIEAKLDNHEARIVRLEERTSIIRG